MPADNSPAQPDGAGLRRRGTRWLVGLPPALALLTLATLMTASADTRLAVRTTLLFPSFFAGLPESPADFALGTPARETVDLPAVHGYVRLHIYRLRGERRPALLLSLGMNPAPPDDKRVVRLMKGLARSGLVAALIESESLSHDQLFPDLPDALVESVQYVAGQAYVRGDRVGLFGFSVGGSLAVVAAARPEIRDALRLVEAFGGFADLEDALLSVATHTLDDGGVAKHWEPDPDAQRHLANALVSAVSNPDEQQALRSLFVDQTAGAMVDPESLSTEARAVYTLLRSRNRAEGSAEIPQLPQQVRDDIAELNPLAAVPGLRTKLFVMYDVDDPLLPFTGSRSLCSAARQAGVPLYCSSFAIFKHVDPTRGGNPIVVTHDLVELFLHSFAVLKRLQ